MHDPHDLDPAIGQSVEQQICIPDQIAQPGADVVPSGVQLRVRGSVTGGHVQSIKDPVSR